MKNYFIEKSRIPFVDMLALFTLILLTAYPNLYLYYSINSYPIYIKYLPEIYIAFVLILMMTPFNNNLRNIYFSSIVFVYTLILYLLSHYDISFIQICNSVSDNYLNLVQIPFISFLYLFTMRTLLILIFKKEPLTLWMRIDLFSDVESIYSERIGRKASYYDFFWTLLNLFVMGAIFIVNLKKSS